MEHAKMKRDWVRVKKGKMYREKAPETERKTERTSKKET